MNKSALGPIPVSMVPETPFYSSLTTDGAKFLENGANVKARAFWAGEFLVIESNTDAGGITIAFVEELTLSKGGNTLSDAIEAIQVVNSARGVRSHDSFERQ